MQNIRIVSLLHYFKKAVFLLGIDLGTSTIKVCLVEAVTGEVVATAASPEQEMPITALKSGWAEQSPEIWWQEVCNAIQKLPLDLRKQVSSVGIAYQMHGLVMIDAKGKAVRPSIIWCDSRATEVGETASQGLGASFCFRRFLNQPSNFTAAKWKWVAINEPKCYESVHKIMLPGDYLAYRLTGEITTTVSGLSEGILWDFHNRFPAYALMDYWGLEAEKLPDICPTFGSQGRITKETAEMLGIPIHTPLMYRAGDQPNNAFSLGVLHPGQVAATAGTSGVVYGVHDAAIYDPLNRINTFVHVNNRHEYIRNGVLLCINGAGRLNAWLRANVTPESSYGTMNALAATAPIGADGLVCLPFGNGTERILQNQPLGAGFFGLDLNRHEKAHLLRAAQEGIVFAMQFGLETMREMGLSVSHIRAGNANLFLSPLFREAFVNTTVATLTLLDTDGAQGAARAAGVGIGAFLTIEEAGSAGLTTIHEESPDPNLIPYYKEAYEKWALTLENQRNCLNPQNHV